MIKARNIDFFVFLFLLLITFPVISHSNIVIACRCSDGIIIGSDSLSVSGTLIGNRVSESVYPLGNHAVICCASGQSDFHHLLKDLRSFIRTADVSIPRNAFVSTSSIAKYARRLVNQKYRNTHLIIAGSDGIEYGDKNDGNEYNNGDDSVDSNNSFDSKNEDEGVINENYEKNEIIENSNSVVDSNGVIVKVTVENNNKNTHPNTHSNTHTNTHTNTNTNKNKHTYTIHEILSGGTLVTQHYAIAGSGSDCVISLMKELFTDKNTEMDQFLYGNNENERNIAHENIEIVDVLSTVDDNNNGEDNKFSVENRNINKNTNVEEFNPFNVKKNNNKSTRTTDNTSYSTIKLSSNRIKKILKSASGFDPRSGSDLRIWSLDKKGLHLI